jgi:hypothetical protein
MLIVENPGSTATSTAADKSVRPTRAYRVIAATRESSLFGRRYYMLARVGRWSTTRRNANSYWPGFQFLQKSPESTALSSRPIWSEATFGRILATKGSQNRWAQNRGGSMAEANQKKCAHVPCTCNVSDKYCSQACKDAGSSETEIACACGHPSCRAQVTA